MALTQVRYLLTLALYKVCSVSIRFLFDIWLEIDI
jgi:hypothetical protein